MSGRAGRPRAGPAWLISSLLFCLSALAGCQATQSAFDLTAGNTGASLAAAATMLRYEHEGRVTKLYAQSSFVNFQSQLQGVETQLPSLAGAPSRVEVGKLLRLYRRAAPAVQNPCLEDRCGWRRQLRALQRASDAFVKAGGG